MRAALCEDTTAVLDERATRLEKEKNAEGWAAADRLDEDKRPLDNKSRRFTGFFKRIFTKDPPSSRIVIEVKTCFKLLN